MDDYIHLRLSFILPNLPYKVLISSSKSLALKDDSHSYTY